MINADTTNETEEYISFNVCMKIISMGVVIICPGATVLLFPVESALPLSLIGWGFIVVGGVFIGYGLLALISRRLGPWSEREMQRIKREEKLKNKSDN